MFLENIIPILPDNRLEFVIFAVSIMGMFLLVYSQFIEAENRRDLIRMIGALSLLVYAVYIQNLLFALTMIGIFLAATIEFIEIYIGYHKHTRTDIEKYERMSKLN
jgi:uncharacterized membrane protein